MHAIGARRPQSLTTHLVQQLGDRVRSGSWPAGTKLPTEGAIMDEFAVSRTVVREAISRLQAAGVLETRHGIGTFVLGHGDGSSFRIDNKRIATLREVVRVLELRIAVETESAALAAERHTPQNIAALRSALDAFRKANEQGRDAVGPDFQFHLEIARATQNPHFADLMATLGGSMIPRARLASGDEATTKGHAYLERVNAEHEKILEAIAAGNASAARSAMRKHLSNSKARRERAAQAAERR